MAILEFCLDCNEETSWTTAPEGSYCQVCGGSQSRSSADRVAEVAKRMFGDQTPQRDHKTVVAGTGRCGTTVMIQLLTRAGMDTGLIERDGDWFLDVPQVVTKLDRKDGRILEIDRTKKTEESVYFPQVNAGCETLICAQDDPKFVRTEIPEVIKDPRLAWYGHELIDKGILSIRHMIVCVRGLQAVSRSKAEGMRGHDLGRWYQKSRGDIYGVSAWQLGVCIAEMTARRVPLTIIEFPRFVEDEDYCYDKLVEAFPHQLGTFTASWKQTVKPELVHYK